MALVDTLKKEFVRVAPARYAQLQELWTAYRIKKITRAITRRHGLVVLDGPFVGMRYVPEAAGSSLLPKLVGSYESELHPTVAAIIGFQYSRIIDVGCAEGYYAVGLARRLPEARVFAFDIDVRARELCEALAKANGVSERVLIAGECGFEELAALSDERTLLICDCEGCELGLLDPSAVPNLRRTDILVELHDMIDESISKTIVSRFEGSHEITLINSADRDPATYEALKPFSDWDRHVAVAEFRDDAMQWAFMRSRQRT